jgi:chorismate dehydratase
VSAAGPLRVGRISALNMYPIYHHLAASADPAMAFTDGLPTALNGALLDGRLDVSAVSSIVYARNAGRLRLLPVASIAASGAVDSIRVFSRVPFEEVRSVAVTRHSATSVALLRIQLGPDVPFVPLVGDPAAALERVDGVLLIADEALHGLLNPFCAHSSDLGELWRRHTGRPMVFAVWAARLEAAERRPERMAELSALLCEAQARYAADPESVVAAAARRFPFPGEFIRSYFRRLRYGFGEGERAGLARFFELARAAGELDVLPRLAA